MNRLSFRLAAALLAFVFGIAIAAVWIARNHGSLQRRPKAVLPLAQAQVPVGEDEDNSPLSKIFTKEDRLAYKGYEIEKAYGGEFWHATLKKGNKTIARFESGGRSKDWTNFGLFPFLDDDTKQLVVEQYSGGAHCCTSYWIYSFSPSLRAIFESDKYETGNEMKPVDIDGDGVFEFTLSVTAFDYFEVSHASSVFPVAIFAYDKAEGAYRPANLKYSDYVLRGIEDDVKKVLELKEKESPKDIGTSERYFSAVLQATLKNIYAGRAEEGWSFFDDHYVVYEKTEKETMRADIQKMLQGEPVYNYIYSQEK